MRAALLLATVAHDLYVSLMLVGLGLDISCMLPIAHCGDNYLILRGSACSCYDDRNRHNNLLGSHNTRPPSQGAPSHRVLLAALKHF